MKKRIARPVKSLIKEDLYNSLNPYSTKWHVNWYKALNEKSYIFNPDSNSTYRRRIQAISKFIMNSDNKDYDIQLYKDNNEIYEKYTILLPFSGVSIINVVNILKIYIHYNNMNFIDVFNVSDDIDTSNFNLNELPLYKGSSSTILQVSIIFDVPYDITKDEIVDMLVHEFSHILNYVKSLKLGNSVSKWGNARDSLIQLLQTYESPVAFNMCGYAANCCYYLLSTEINAHIENIISEFKLNQFNKETALLLCKYANSLLSQNIKLDDYETVKYYLESDNSFTIYVQLHERTNYYKRTILYEETSYMKEIALTIYPNTLNPCFKNIIDYWDKQLQLFFRNLSAAIYNNY